MSSETMKIRSLRGSLRRSMLTAEEIPATLEAVKEYVAKHAVDRKVLDVMVEPYADFLDARIGWERTYLVSSKLNGESEFWACGYCDKMPENTNESA